MSVSAYVHIITTNVLGVEFKSPVDEDGKCVGDTQTWLLRGRYDSILRPDDGSEGSGALFKMENGDLMEVELYKLKVYGLDKSYEVYRMYKECGFEK
jgi:hypothetical protein